MIAGDDGSRYAGSLHQLGTALLLLGLGASQGQLGQGERYLLLHFPLVTFRLVGGGEKMRVGGSVFTEFLQRIVGGNLGR